MLHLKRLRHGLREQSGIPGERFHIHAPGVGPIEVMEQDFPCVREAIMSVRHQISNDLPMLFFQSRESPPKAMVVAVPFWKDTGNPFNCRLATVRSLSAKESELYGNVAQVF